MNSLTSCSLKTFGKAAEKIAADFFRERGYTVLEHNFRTRIGEIDLILEMDNVIIFVEVKARRTATHGLPQEAVGTRKQRQIIRTAQLYLQKKGWLDRIIRFDVLALRFYKGYKVDMEHIQWAFGTDG